MLFVEILWVTQLDDQEEVGFLSVVTYIPSQLPSFSEIVEPCLTSKV